MTAPAFWSRYRTGSWSARRRRPASPFPPPARYAVGLAFLPGEPDDAAKAKKVVEALAVEEGLAVLGWRPVPVVTEGLGETALSVMPIMEQLFVVRAGGASADAGSGSEGTASVPGPT